MRRPLIVPTKGAEWRVSPFLIYDTNGNVVQPQNACGPYEERRDVQCVVNERPVGDSYCRDVGPKPEDSKQSFIDTGCSYDWYQGQWQDPGPSCSNAEAQQRTVECRRSYDDVKVADALCSGTKPVTERTVVDHSTCTYSWNSSDPFADPGQNCTATEEWTRDVFCERDLDKVQVADGQCDAGRTPTTIDVREDYSSCSYSWDAEEDFTDPGDSCTANETQTRAVWCRRDLDDNVEADTKCDAAARPAATQSVEDFSGCDYSWDPQTWGAWDSQCSSTANRTRTVNCLRSDGTVTNDMAARCLEDDGAKPDVSETKPVYDSCTYDWVPGAWQDPGASCSANEAQSRTVTCRSSDGRDVADSFCTKPKLATSRTVEDYSSCSYAWVQGGFQDPGPSCTASETQNQTVTCRRSDGTTVANSECNPATKPPTTQTVADYSACSYSWVEGGFGAWNSTCSNNASRTQTVTCRRSDGTTVTSGCNAATKPATSESMAIYSTCSYTANYGAWGACDGTSRSRTMATCTRSTGDNVALSNCTSRGDPLTETESCVTYSWKQEGWGAWNNTCSSNASRPANYVCKSSSGNTTVADGNCAGPKPSGSESGAVYSSCSYSAVNWTGWSYASACSTSTSRTRTADCRRSDGTIVSDSECTGRGVALTETQNGVSNTAGCTYAAANWTNPANPTCSAANTETQTADCRRSDGTIVSDSVCTGQGISLTRTVSNNADYSGCSYSAVNWTNPANPTCSGANTETQTADCRRSDGTIVSDSTCTSRGVSLTRTVSNGADYSGCSYQWITGGWQDPGSSCTPNETQTRSVICRRTQTGETVSDGYCGGGKPATTQTVEDYSGCTPTDNLTVNWGGWSGWSSSCSTSATRTRSGTCLASGTPVASSVCTSRGLAVTDSESSAQYSGCSYTPTYGAYGACSNGVKTASMTSCKRNGVNQTVSTSYCTGAGHPATSTQACTQTVLFTGTWGDRNGYSCYTGWQNGERINANEQYSPVESMSPAWANCRNQGGTYVEMTRVGQCRWVSDNYRQDYDSGGTFRCIREQ